MWVLIWKIYQETYSGLGDIFGVDVDESSLSTERSLYWFSAWEANIFIMPCQFLYHATSNKFLFHCVSAIYMQ